MTASDVYVLLTVAIVLVIAALGLLLLAVGRLRRRKAQLLEDLSRNPRLAEDRAFNRLEMARREVAILDRQGVEISRARDLVSQSQAAFDQQQFPRAYELAQSAHESLVNARLGRPLEKATAASSAPPPMTSRAAPSGMTTPPGRGATPLAAGAAAGPASGPATGAAAAPVTSPGLPRNRVESAFELKLLDAELAPARKAHPSAPATTGAIALRDQAQTAFDAGLYTDALRLALRARRGLGANVESVAPPQGGGPTNGGLPTAGFSDRLVDPAQAAERASAGEHCPQCGYPTSPDDVYCRGCGTPRTATTCSKCGTPRTSTDTFCGRCGQRFS